MSTIHDTTPSAVRAGSDSVAGNRTRLIQTCRQVEGLFLSHLMEAMDRPSFGEGILGSSGATKLFRSRRNQAIADEMGARGDLGLAEMLYNDLSNHAGADGVTDAALDATATQGADSR